MRACVFGVAHARQCAGVIQLVYVCVCACVCVCLGMHVCVSHKPTHTLRDVPHMIGSIFPCFLFDAALRYRRNIFDQAGHVECCLCIFLLLRFNVPSIALFKSLLRHYKTAYNLLYYFILYIWISLIF